MSWICVCTSAVCYVCSQINWIRNRLSFFSSPPEHNFNYYSSKYVFQWKNWSRHPEMGNIIRWHLIRFTGVLLCIWFNVFHQSKEIDKMANMHFNFKSFWNIKFPRKPNKVNKRHWFCWYLLNAINVFFFS